MEQQTQWTRPGYRPNYNGGTPPPQMGTMNRPFAQTVTPELSRAERLEAQRLAEQSRFDPNAYQVVRREFIANRFCQSMTIRNKSITFNNACISALEDAIYVQFLINPTELKLAIRPCEEGARDAVRWCNVREDKRKSRQITCKPLAEKLFALMDWEAVYSYRFQGMKIDYDGEIYYMFDLSGSEPYLPRRRDPETGKVIPSQTIVREDWKDSFGMNFAEHEASQKIDLMQGYVTAAVTEDAPIVTAEIK